MKTIILNHVSQADHGDLIKLVKAFDHSESDGRDPDHKHYPAGTYAMVDLAQGDDLIRLDFNLPEYIVEIFPGLRNQSQDPNRLNQLTLQAFDFQILTSFELIWSPENPFSWYVNTYLVDRARGGGEEGGWYFDFGMPVDSIGCNSHLAARILQKEIDTRNKELNQDRPEISSVLSEGRYHSAVETQMAKAWPENKPHYE